MLVANVEEAKNHDTKRVEKFVMIAIWCNPREPIDEIVHKKSHTDA